MAKKGERRVVMKIYFKKRSKAYAFAITYNHTTKFQKKINIVFIPKSAFLLFFFYFLIKNVFFKSMAAIELCKKSHHAGKVPAWWKKESSNEVFMKFHFNLKINQKLTLITGIEIVLSYSTKVNCFRYFFRPKEF